MFSKCNEQSRNIYSFYSYILTLILNNFRLQECCKKCANYPHPPVTWLPYVLTTYIMTVQVSKQEHKIDTILLTKLQRFSKFHKVLHKCSLLLQDLIQDSTLYSVVMSLWSPPVWGSCLVFVHLS